jgi:hypothetical protein
VARQVEPEPVLTEAERTEALELLQDPRLVERILADYAACGLVGEETNSRRNGDSGRRLKPEKRSE